MRAKFEYGYWEIHPQMPKLFLPREPLASPEIKVIKTLYEGEVTYLKFWNYWVRAGMSATAPTDAYFQGYESVSNPVTALISAIGTPTYCPHTEKELWNRIATVWSWLGANVRVDHGAYASLTTLDRWPSIDEFAGYFAQHHDLIWSGCFSKAHLFAMLLGRVLPRWHVLIAIAHHTESGAPPTAAHVYVGVYLTDRWYYLDPMEVYSGPLPHFKDRRSIGPFNKVDYQHPFQVIPLPLSPLNLVPLMPS